MDTINGINSAPNILDYLYAHEIAHSAQNGEANGGADGDRNRNPENGPVFACKEIVSTYGQAQDENGNPIINKFENNADAISYYMTLCEEGNNYKNYPPNKTGNLKTDHPCTYNALMNGFFKQGPAGVPIEYDL